MPTERKHGSLYGKPRPDGAQSIQRAISVLREVASANRGGVRLVDLTERLRLEKPTVHRILKALTAEGLLQQNDQNRRYYLGQAMFEIGLAASQQFNLRDLCRNTLSRIAEKTEDTVFLNLRSGHEAVCAERMDGSFPIKVYTLNVGDRRPLGVGAGGLAILSALSEDEVESVMKGIARDLPRYGGLSVRMLTERIAKTRELGYACNEVAGVPGFAAIGVAIRNRTKDAFASLSVSALSSRLSGKRREQLAELLQAEARALERLLNQQAQRR